ncbi:hypothetical protein GCM10022376_26200 [Yimella lutea]
MLADAVCTASVNTTIAKTALDNIDTIKAVLPAADRGEVFSWFLGLEPGSGAKAVHELTKRIIATFDDEVLDDTEDAPPGTRIIDLDEPARGHGPVDRGPVTRPRRNREARHRCVVRTRAGHRLL